MPLRRRVVRIVRAVAILVVAVPVAIVVLYRFVDPPLTPLMVLRLLEGEGLQKDWVRLEAISPHLRRAVIAAEDNRFCEHWGFDVGELEKQVAAWGDGKRPRGASTISMQTAKNILLWPDRHSFRKVLEVPLTGLIELVWPKRRILEVYLNVAETGAGRYGAEAAARADFGVAAADLSRRQAALIATALPSPRTRSPARPSATHLSRARTIERRIDQLGPTYFACVTDR